METRSTLRRHLAEFRDDLRFMVINAWLNRIVGAAITPRILRPRLYSLAGHRVSRSNLFPGIRFLGSGRVTIEENAMVNWGVVFDNKADVVIRRRAHVAHEVLFCTSTHSMGDAEKRAATVTVSPIVIGPGAWIGARAILLPGVTVGSGTVIAAGAVVTADCEPNSVYAGVPARLKRRL